MHLLRCVSRNRAILLPALLCVATSGGGSAAADTIRYTLTPRFERGLLEVELTWTTEGRTQSAIGVSSHWGRISSVPAMLKDLEFEGAAARSDGARWILSHPKGATIRARYVVDAGHRSFDTWEYTHHPITTRRFFHGMGNAFLLVPQKGPGTESLEAILRWRLPAGYAAVCSWGVGRHVGARIKPTDLRHSVYMAGRLATKTVEHKGRSITVAMIDEFAFDAEAFAALTAKIIKGQCDFMLEKNFPEFVVTAIPVGPPLKPGESKLAGTGLYNSFALFVAPGSKLNDAVEHLFAHELFHFWNGRLLPARQPERRVFWFVEGFTDYYALRILYESGVWDAATFAKWINKHIREYVQNPAINATNDQIDRGYWTQRDTVGEVAYQRGLMLGLRWHKLARDRGVSGGIDRLFRSLVDRGRGGGYEVSNASIRSAGARILGSWFPDEFDRFVSGAATVSLPDDALGPAFSGRVRDVYAYALGFDRDRSLEQRKVRGLVHGSPAERAGLREGDELVGWNLYADPDKKTRLEVRRGTRRQSISFFPRGPKRSVLQFTVR